MNKFDLIKKEILDILPKSPLAFEQIHAKLVLEWVLKLKPDADEALQIAALSHDIERAITGITEKDLDDYSKINEFKKEHSIRSANIITEILAKHDYSQNTINKVKLLVENHEFGGDQESDILKNADSLAYFSYNIPFNLKRMGREKTKLKIQFMYNRLSDDAKNLVNQIKFLDKDIKILVKEAIS